jgi:hypothetical protein
MDVLSFNSSIRNSMDPPGGNRNEKEPFSINIQPSSVNFQRTSNHSYQPGTLTLHIN